VGLFCPPGSKSGSTDLIESGSNTDPNPDPKPWETGRTPLKNQAIFSHVSFAEGSNPTWMQNKKDLLLNRTTGGWGPRSCRRLKQKQQELEDELLAFEIYKQQVYQSGEESAMRTNYSGDLQHIYENQRYRGVLY
jgi:hypothetical protein